VEAGKGEGGEPSAGRLLRRNIQLRYPEMGARAMIPAGPASGSCGFSSDWHGNDPGGAMKKAVTTLGAALSLATLPLMAMGQEANPFPAPPLVNPGDIGGRLLVMRVLPLVFLLAVVICVLTFQHLRSKRRNELLARFVDRGQPIPAGLLAREPSRQGAQRAGALLLGFALGLGLLMYFLTEEWRPSVALAMLPLFLGIASFVNAAFFYPDSRR
jgi:hypothetical protein